jgi:hypothetical protein
MTRYPEPGSARPDSPRPEGPGLGDRGRRLAVPVFVLSSLLLAPATASADPPAPLGPDAPAAQNDNEDGKQGPTIEAAIEQSFRGLADGDAAARERARAELLAMDRRHLPFLQSLVERSSPVLPSQAAVLRGIVTHVYLAGEPYDTDRDAGFLGVRMHPVAVRLPPDDPARAGLDDEPGANAGGDDAEPPAPVPPFEPGEILREAFPTPRLGVVIVERLAGFVGERLLRDGDVIVGFADRPDQPFRDGSDFTEPVKKIRPGRPVHLVVLRQGRLVKVSIPLDPRPTAADQMNTAAMDALDARRREKAEAYWRQSFARLLREDVG